MAQGEGKLLSPSQTTVSPDCSVTCGAVPAQPLAGGGEHGTGSLESTHKANHSCGELLENLAPGGFKTREQIKRSHMFGFGLDDFNFF